MDFENREPLARSRDESTSHAAGEALTRSGRRSSQKMQLLEWVKITIGEDCKRSMTANEIAHRSAFDHPMVHKRLPDLARDGFVKKCAKRVCQRTGLECVTWRAATGDEIAAHGKAAPGGSAPAAEPEQEVLFR